MGGLSIWHWVIVLIVVLLLFGKNKIPGLMGDVAKGINAFKKGLKDDDARDGSEPAEAPKTIDQAKTGATVSDKDHASDKG